MFFFCFSPIDRNIFTMGIAQSRGSATGGTQGSLVPPPQYIRKFYQNQ